MFIYRKVLWEILESVRLCVPDHVYVGHVNVRRSEEERYSILIAVRRRCRQNV